MTALRILVLGCSGASTGELTLTFDWIRRLSRDVEVHVLVNELAASSAKWFGATVHGFPRDGGRPALAFVERVFEEVQPDLLVVADLLLAYLTSPEFGRYFRRGPNLLPPFLERAAQRCRVVGLDLYDWDANGEAVDLFGRPGQRSTAPVPASIRRLMPSPYLAPAPSTPGRGRYPLMRRETPASDEERGAIRASLGLGDEKLVFLATSPWQHMMAGHREAASVSIHLPTLLLDWVDLLRERVPLTLVHLGPSAIATRAGYKHVPQLAPEEFRRLLSAADLVLSPNTIATTNIRAAAFGVPVCAVTLSSIEAPKGDDPATAAARSFFDRSRDVYPWHVWPLGLHRLMERLLEDNPFAGMQTTVDVREPERAIDRMTELLRSAVAIDELRHSQRAYFDLLDATVDDAEGALDALLK